MSTARAQEIRSIYKSQLYFDIIAINNSQHVNNFIHNSIKKNKIYRNRFTNKYKTCTMKITNHY